MEFNIKNMIRPHLLDSKSYQSLRNSYLQKEVVLLDANENPFGSYNRYPDAEHLQ